MRLAQSSLAVIEAPQQIDTDRETVDVAGRVMVPGAATLTIDGDPVPVAADGSFRVRRRVPVGPSRLTLVLEGSYGDKAEHKVLVRRTAAVAATLDFGTFHALVIGNNNYDHLDDLETGRADAEAVAALLSGLYGFEVEILIDATRADIISALARKRAQLTERDNLLIYYAGHGKLDVRSDEGYWLPTDAESDNPVNWISNTTVSAQLRAMSAKHVMVVADSCYTGRLTRSAETVLKTGAERTVWLKNTNARRSRTVLTSGELAPVANGGTHSVFAQAFLTALQMSEQILVSRFRSSHDFRLLFSDFDCSEAEALDGAEDVIGGFGPFEGFGVLVCRVDVVEDGALQLLGGAMDAAPDLLVGQQPEPALDLVQPGGAGGCEMGLPARPFGEPVADRLGLVGPVVVHDDVDVEISRDVRLDEVEEFAELSGPMARETFADDLSRGDVEGREERGRAVALVVVAAPLRLPGAHRQEGLGTVQGLDLALFVDTENQGTIRRRQIQTDDVADLLHEEGIGSTA